MFNHPVFADPNTTVGNVNFGKSAGSGECAPAGPVRVEVPLLMRIPLIILLMAATIRAAPSQEMDPAVSAILKANCAECHSDATRTSGFSVSSSGSVFAGGNKYGKAVIAGHPAGSPLLKLLRGELQPQMPMGKKLAGADIDRIEQWIRSLPAQAAQAATEWRWPFEKPVKKAAPSVRNAAWVGNEIDAFILAQLEQKGISPAPPASPRTLARRAYSGPHRASSHA